MALASPPATPPPESISSPSSSSLSPLPGLTRTTSHPPQTDFDVIAHYKNSIKSNPALPVPIAAIESLVALLTHTPLTTVSETLALIDSQSLVLRQWAANPIPISAGTDLFQRAKLVATSKLFTSKAKIASQQIAVNFLPLVVDDALVFTHATTPLVDTVIRHAVDDGPGSHMLALAARNAGIPVYCTVESFNFVRPYPLSADAAELKKLGIVPAALITALVTENGIMAPSSVSEELIKLWF
ncbi:hypothetical protein DV738_g4227, partial [Chaetothyriales sp. CBS 135597]